MLLTTASLSAGALPSLFIVLGLGDLLGRFDRLRAFELGRPAASGLHLALAMTSEFTAAVAITGVGTIVVVALLQLQPQRRRLSS